SISSKRAAPVNLTSGGHRTCLPLHSPFTCWSMRKSLPHGSTSSQASFTLGSLISLWSKNTRDQHRLEPFLRVDLSTSPPSLCATLAERPASVGTFSMRERHYVWRRSLVTFR